jgi:hypothetical protein
MTGICACERERTFPSYDRSDGFEEDLRVAQAAASGSNSATVNVIAR